MLLKSSKIITQSISCTCPHCGKSDLFPKRITLQMIDECQNCGLILSNHDSADAPAVFAVFILGIILAPFAILIDHFAPMPLWAQIIIWGTLILGLTIGLLPPLKSLAIAIDYKYRPEGWHFSQKEKHKDT